MRDEGLLAPALGVARALRWTGIAGMNVMRGVDGLYYFIEFNPRPWGSINVVELAGVNLFRPLAALLSGGSVDPELSYADDVDSGVFIKLAMDRLESGGLEALRAFATEPRAWLDLRCSDPRLSLYAIRRLISHWKARTLERSALKVWLSGHGMAPRRARVGKVSTR